MAYPDRLSATVTIGGVDVTDLIDPQKGVTIQNVLTRKADTCSFKLDRTSGVNPSAWQEIVVSDGATRIFAGYSQDIDEDEGADLLLDHKISATDYSIRLEKVIVKKQYENMTDRAILADLFSTYLSGEGFNVSTHVSTIKTHTRIRFNRITLLDCIKVLADLASADYYVDYDKYLWFFKTDTGASTAPFALSDSPDLTTSMPYSDFSLNRDGSGVVNRVEVIGGNYRSDDTTFYLPGTGQEKKIILPFKLHAPDGETGVLIYRNDGTLGAPVWTQLDVLAGYLQQLTTTTEVLYYFNEKVIEQQDPFPNLANAVKIIAKYEVPLRTRVSDDVSIAHYGLILDGLIVDNQITDKPTARIAALAKLAAASMETVAITLTTYQPGLQAGQIVSVVNSIHGINSSYLVQKVTTKIGIAGAARYSITLGTYNPSLIDLILTLSRQAKPKIDWRDDEVLDELLQKAEGITFSEVNTDVDSAQPYFFSDDPAYAFDWGFGSFDADAITLRDTFTTADPAPVASPRTCEPGPGTLTLSDASNKFSISGGALINAGNVAASNPMAYTSGVVRALGVAFWYKIKLTSGTSGSYASFGLHTTAANPSYYSFSLNNGAITDNSMTIATPDVLSVGVVYDLVMILRTTGAYYFIKGGVFTDWVCAWVSGTGTTTPLYSVMSARPTVGATWEVYDTSNMVLRTAFTTQFGYAKNYLASPVSGDVTTMDADGFIQFSWTPAAAETLEISFRRTDDNNRWIWRCSQAGSTTRIIEVNAGVETQRTTAATTFTVGATYLMQILAIGSYVRVTINTAGAGLYATATFNQTATGVKVSGFATGANLAIYPRTPPTGVIMELENLCQ